MSRLCVWRFVRGLVPYPCFGHPLNARLYGARTVPAKLVHDTIGIQGVGQQRDRSVGSVQLHPPAVARGPVVVGHGPPVHAREPEVPPGLGPLQDPEQRRVAHEPQPVLGVEELVLRGVVPRVPVLPVVLVLRPRLEAQDLQVRLEVRLGDAEELGQAVAFWNCSKAGLARFATNVVWPCCSRSFALKLTFSRRSGPKASE
mmetsp:Transcript_34664/g.97266  ORF Transcript_34664/g.97266 Transcript_34664/m.97266 type:complete len:201 (-) Transcript_34664:759-1361(-)